MGRDTEATRLERTSSAALDALLGAKVPVLDDGFVRVVDYMGNEAAIVRAARVSYGAGTKSVREDAQLIRYLMRNYHTSPFEQAEITLHVRVPMDTWRQWIRHRMSSTNEYSTRYSEAIDSMAKTEPDAWRIQSTTNRQGSEDVIPIITPATAHLSERERELHELSRSVYQERLELGVAREQARKDLPLSTYTEAYWKIDLHNLLHFLRLRMDEHAQLEIRRYAGAIAQVVKQWMPNVWQAFLDFRLNALTLSAQTIAVVRAIHLLEDGCASKLASEYGWLETRPDGTRVRSGERDDCEAALVRIGLKIPWLYE